MPREERKDGVLGGRERYWRTLSHLTSNRSTCFSTKYWFHNNSHIYGYTAGKSHRGSVRACPGVIDRLSTHTFPPNPSGGRGGTRRNGGCRKGSLSAYARYHQHRRSNQPKEGSASLTSFFRQSFVFLLGPPKNNAPIHRSPRGLL